MMVLDDFYGLAIVLQIIFFGLPILTFLAIVFQGHDVDRAFTQVNSAQSQLEFDKQQYEKAEYDFMRIDKDRRQHRDEEDSEIEMICASFRRRLFD